MSWGATGHWTVQVPPRARGEVKEISFTGLANQENRSEIFGFLAVSCFCGGHGGAVTGRGGAGAVVWLVPGTPSGPSGGGWFGAVQFGVAVAYRFGGAWACRLPLVQAAPNWPRRFARVFGAGFGIEAVQNFPMPVMMRRMFSAAIANATARV